jgi:predicted P-loop ATPase
MNINLNYDGQLDFATGKSRMEISWRNKEITWKALLEKLQTTTRTSETLAEYAAAKKTKQDDIKDIGGFVGGFLTGGRRKSGSILHRQLITLDLDFATNDFWDLLTMTQDFACAVYSTHKHTEKTPRFRLLIPLDRPVDPSEYIAISRRIAGDIDIELFDPTSFEPERLMYWPSTSSDGVYVFEYQDGPWACADAILARYKDWKDSSEWPISDKVDKLIHRTIKKQGDPIEKTGMLGAFCRAFTIHEAIAKFLPDVYDECSDGRYTYKHGSTAGGLIIYEDKWAYSHHGTDPVSGKLCNAFDLVRIHLFGMNDEGTNDRSNVTKLPSFKEMCDLCTQDPTVRKQLGIERQAEAADDFGTPITGGGEHGEGLPIDQTLYVSPSGEVTTRKADPLGGSVGSDDLEDESDWMSKLEVDRKGNYLSTVDNVVLILKNDPRLKGCLATDAFACRECTPHGLPWRSTKGQFDFLVPSDDAGMRHYFEKVYNITGRFIIKDGMTIILQKNRFHPIHDYFKGLEWDEINRVDSLLIDYLGAEDSAYTRAVTRKTLVAAVARVMDPGCKFDSVLTLIGTQGIGKSQLLARLGKQWYSDSFGGLGSKEAFELIQGKWIIEIAELAGLKKAEVDTIKHFISKTDDYYRVPYTERPANFKRQCIFIATTNDFDGFLKDTTGNRRWWPVVTNSEACTRDIFKDLNDYEIDQVWAEAMELYKAGEKLYLTGDVADYATGIQADHVETDFRFEGLKAYLDMEVPADWYKKDLYERLDYIGSVERGQADPGEDSFVRDRISPLEIWCEFMRNKRSDAQTWNTKPIAQVVRNMGGWVLSKNAVKTEEYGRQRVFIRVNSIFDTLLKHKKN